VAAESCKNSNFLIFYNRGKIMRLHRFGVLVGAISALVSQQPLHAQQSETEADLAAKGPFAHRPFARIVGAPFVAAEDPASESRRGTLVVDPVTKKTN
jgi:hypothetical protein